MLHNVCLLLSQHDVGPRFSIIVSKFCEGPELCILHIQVRIQFYTLYVTRTDRFKEHVNLVEVPTLLVWANKLCNLNMCNV